MRNLLTGGAVIAFILGVYAYSISAVKQDDFVSIFTIGYSEVRTQLRALGLPGSAICVPVRSQLTLSPTSSICFPPRPSGSSLRRSRTSSVKRRRSQTRALALSRRRPSPTPQRPRGPPP